MVKFLCQNFLLKKTDISTEDFSKASKLRYDLFKLVTNKIHRLETETSFLKNSSLDESSFNYNLDKFYSIEFKNYIENRLKKKFIRNQFS